MKNSCLFVLDATTARRSELVEHARGCPECARSLERRDRVRTAWRAANDRDEANEAVARVRRMRGRASELTAGRRSGSGSALAAVVGVALCAASSAAMVAGAHRRSLETSAEAPAVRHPLEAPAVSAAVAPRAAPLDPAAQAQALDRREDDGPAQGFERREAAPPSAPRRPVAEPGAFWRAAEDALLRGDRDGAEASLRALLATNPRGPLATKAELRLGELLLARGATAEARARLEPLVAAGDPDIADDARWLYVRTFPDPRDRAEAWRRLLASSPAGPMRDVAAVERAEALRAAGDLDAARDVVRSLGDSPVAPVAATKLARLRAALSVRTP